MLAQIYLFLVETRPVNTTKIIQTCYCVVTFYFCLFVFIFSLTFSLLSMRLFVVAVTNTIIDNINLKNAKIQYEEEYDSRFLH